jgi:organic hydroperoxide reductase OsmC/OhrA
MPDTPRLGTEFAIEIDQVDEYEFRVRLDKPQYPELLVDAPAPVGKDLNPSPSRLLAAAMGHCLASGLLYCARKLRVSLGPIHARVVTEIVRNDRGYPRIGKMHVEIDTQAPESEQAEAARCTRMFEDFCMVSQSVREGIEVEVRVNGLPL